MTMVRWTLQENNRIGALDPAGALSMSSRGGKEKYCAAVEAQRIVE